jgi:hypothetical protein
MIAQLVGLCLMAAVHAGCGGSSQVHELPEASRKALDKRKVDVEQRPAKSPSASQRLPKGRASAR